MSVVEEDTNREDKRSATSSSKGLFVLGELGKSEDKKGPSVSTSTSTSASTSTSTSASASASASTSTSASASVLSRSDNGGIISSALLVSGEELANKERNTDKDNILLDLLVRIGS